MSANWSDETVLALAVEKSSDINSLVDINGRQVSHLMVACFHGNSDYVKDLLEVPGIKTNLQNEEGVQCACELGHTEIAQQILNTSQSLINLPRNDGATSLLIASSKGHTETVSMLLQNNANVNMQRNDGFSSLMLAMSQWPHRNCHNVTSKWCSHQHAKNNGASSLMLASQNGHTETVTMLLQNGATRQHARK